MVAAPQKCLRCLFPFCFLTTLFFPPPIDSVDFDPHHLRLAQRALRSDLTWSAMTPNFSMSNQQPTGFSWNSPAENTPTFGTPLTRLHSFWSSLQSLWSEDPGNTGPGTYGRFYDFNAHRPAWTSLHTHRYGGPDHSCKLCQHAGRTGPGATGRFTYSQPLNRYAWNRLRLFSLGLGNSTLHQRPVPGWQPPRHTGVYLPTPATPQIPLIPTCDYIPITAQAVPQQQQPYTYTAPPPTGPYPTMPNHAMAPPAPPLAPPPACSYIQSPCSPPPPPPRSIPPRRRLDTMDLSTDVPPPPPRMPVYSPYPFHPSIMDETGLFYKESQRIIDRFSAEIGGRDLSRRFQGIVNPEAVTSLDMTNHPVIFTEKFRSGFASLSSWALPVDQRGRGDQPSKPLRDERTPNRVTVLL